MPSTIAASHGCSTRRRSGDRGGCRRRSARRGVRRVGSGRPLRPACGAESPGRSLRRATTTTPPIASALARIPRPVVPEFPMAGNVTKPARSTPAVAPAVFAAYSAPVARPACAAVAANHRTAIGNVAPSASAGIDTSTKHEARRAAGNITGDVPSWYAHARRGISPSSANGSAIAASTTTASRPTYASRLRRGDRRRAT